MSESIGFEVQFFLVSILTGAFILIGYDVIRIVRRIIGHGKVAVALEDILFWIISSIVIFAMMYQQNNGIIRGFSIMGMLLGMILYNQLISGFFIKVGTTIIHKLSWLIRKIVITLLTPFRFIFGVLFRGITAFLSFIFKKIKLLHRYNVKRLKKTMKTVKIALTRK